MYGSASECREHIHILKAFMLVIIEKVYKIMFNQTLCA